MIQRPIHLRQVGGTRLLDGRAVGGLYWRGPRSVEPIIEPTSSTARSVAASDVMPTRVGRQRLLRERGTYVIGLQ